MRGPDAGRRVDARLWRPRLVVAEVRLRLELEFVGLPRLPIETLVHVDAPEAGQRRLQARLVRADVEAEAGRLLAEISAADQ
jgi:hypothetical protein